MSCANHSDLVYESKEWEAQRGTGPSVCRKCDQPLCLACTQALIAYQCPDHHEESEIDSCPLCHRRIKLKTDAVRFCFKCLPQDEAGEVSVYAYPDDNTRALQFIIDTFDWSRIYKAIQAIEASDEEQIIRAKRCQTLPELVKVISDLPGPDLLYSLMESFGINTYKLGKHLCLTPFQLDFYYDATVLDFSCKRCKKKVKVAFRDLPDACTTHCSSCVDPEPPQKKNRI